MPARLFAATLLIVVAASALVMSGCEPSSPAASASVTPTSSSPVSPSSTPTPSETPSPTPSETPEPVTPPESEYTDSALASMVAAVSVAGQQPQVMSAQQVRWTIASVSVNPQECAILVTGLSSAAARGLPVAMATLGTETDRYTITIVGADEPTREQVTTDRRLASKRCPKLTTVYGDPGNSNSRSTEWVARQGSPSSDLEDVIETDLTTDSGAQQRVIAGRLGNVLIQVSSETTGPEGGEQLTEVVAAVVMRVRTAQGSATPGPTAPPSGSNTATPSPSPSVTPSP